MSERKRVPNRKRVEEPQRMKMSSEDSKNRSRSRTSEDVIPSNPLFSMEHGTPDIPEDIEKCAKTGFLLHIYIKFIENQLQFIHFNYIFRRDFVKSC